MATGKQNRYHTGKEWAGALVSWLWKETHVLKAMSSNSCNVYWVPMIQPNPVRISVQLKTFSFIFLQKNVVNIFSGKATLFLAAVISNSF